MNIRVLRATCAGVVCLFAACAAIAQVSVTTQHNDNSRTGQNVAETTLTLSNVNSTHFGLLHVLSLDGQVYAQPLVLTNVAISGGTHNVLYIATENDSIYAFDADTGTLYWHVSFINPSGGISAPSSGSVQINCGDINPQYGITSTPVIDPVAGTIYAMVYTLESGAYYYRLHALSVSTGAERTGSPVVIHDSQGIFNAQYQNQRTSLLLSGGHLIFGTSAHCDHNSWYGIVFSYNSTTLVRENDFVTVPPVNGGQAGVWMGDDGIAADSSGNIFFSTGNGDSDGTTSFGESILKLPPPPASGSWTPADWYTPSDHVYLDNNDFDLGSGGVLLLPDLPAGAAHQHLLAQAGKGEGTITIADRSNLGHLCCTSGPVQIITGQIPNGMFGSPSYWNGHIYFSGTSDPISAFSFNTTTGAVSTVPVAETASSFGGSSHQSATTSVSSNGTANGIVWALDAGTGILHALNATTLAEIYNSNQAASGRDSLGTSGIKFLAPTIANGKVYVGANNNAGIYGEFPTDVAYSGNWYGSLPTCSSAGAASVTVDQKAINGIDWSFTSYAGAGTVSKLYYNISDTAGQFGTGTISGGVGTIIVSRAPVSAPIVSGSLAIMVPNGLGGYNKCTAKYSIQTQ